MLARRLIELDSLYTVAELREGYKLPISPNDYSQAKPFVRETVASLFFTEIDLVYTQPLSILIEKHSERSKQYDIVEVELKEEIKRNQSTKEEEYLITEQTLFKRMPTDRFTSLEGVKQFDRMCKEGPNVDAMRRKIVFNFICTINDLSLSSRFVDALLKLPSVLSLPESMQMLIISSLQQLRRRVTLLPETNKALITFSKDLLTSESAKIKSAGIFLYCSCSQFENEEIPIDILTYQDLLLSLLILITTKKGDLQTLKDAFFRICTEIEIKERDELLLLFAHLGVKLSPNLKGNSSVLEEFNSLNNHNALTFYL